MNPLKAIDFLAARLLRRSGCSSWAAPLLWRRIKKDFFAKTGVPIRQKLWAYRLGFLSDKITRYSLSNANANLYLPELRYLAMHPINGKYGRWIDDKLTLRHTYGSYAEFLPKYYFHLDSGCVLRLPDCPGCINRPPTIDDVLALLHDEGCFAIKPLSASGGRGFYKLSAIDGVLAINNIPATTGKVKEFLKQLHDHIVTEYLFSHPEIRNIYSGTPNTVRLIAIYDRDFGPQIVHGSIRFGVKASGLVDNVDAGGLFCLIDLNDGRLSQARQLISGRMTHLDQHPDSGKTLIGFVLPNWGDIKITISEIGSRYPQLRWVGYDIVITEKGFKIIEINSLPDIEYIQEEFGPLLANEHARRFFEGRL